MYNYRKLASHSVKPHYPLRVLVNVFTVEPIINTVFQMQKSIGERSTIGWHADTPACQPRTDRMPLDLSVWQTLWMMCLTVVGLQRDVASVTQNRDEQLTELQRAMDERNLAIQDSYEKKVNHRYFRLLFSSLTLLLEIRFPRCLVHASTGFKRRTSKIHWFGYHFGFNGMLVSQTPTRFLCWTRGSHFLSFKRQL